MGEELLLVHCAIALRDAGHRVVAVVADHADLRQWADAEGLRCLPANDYADTVVDLAPDLFVSAANLRIVPERVLDAAQIAAINFHDGILPDYAGLNAPSWALANRENEHGVTWHVMDATVDTGGVLKQKVFSIDATTTAQVLNLQCFDAGLQAFHDLLADLTSDDGLAVHPQSGPAKRYYAKVDRPLGGGFVHWSSSADDICALFRATSFGTADNPFAKARLQIDDHVYLVTGMQCPPPNDEATGASRGTVLRVAPDRLLVQAAPGAVGLTSLTEVDGRPVSLAAVAARHDLAAGTRLPLLSAADDDLLDRRSKGALRAEARALRRLDDLTPLHLPFVHPENGSDDRLDRWQDLPGPALHRHLLGASAASDARAEHSAGECVAAAFGVFLARVTGMDRYTLGLADASTTVDPRFADLFARQVPVQIDAETTVGVDRLLDLVFEVHDARERGSYLRDVFARYPRLQAQVGSEGVADFEVLVKVHPDPASRTLLPGSAIVFAVHEDGTCARWIADAGAVDAAEFDRLVDRFGAFLSRFVEDIEGPAAATVDAIGGDGLALGRLAPGLAPDDVWLSSSLDRPASVVDTYPLTAMQQGMLYHVLSDPAAGTDVEQMVWTLDEPVNGTAFRAAWASAIKRHPILRTRFRWDDVPAPVQEVLDQAAMSFVRVNLLDQTKTEQADVIDAFLDADRRRGIPMDEAPLMRLTLFELGPEHSRMVWTFSHAILDGRSFTRVVEEVFDEYDALCAGTTVTLDAPRPYRAYVDWMEAQDWSLARAYWADYLDGVTGATPLDVVDPSADAPETVPVRARRSQSCTTADTTAIRQAAEAAGVTVNTMLMAAWGLLLHGYSGRRDVLFGATRAGRKGTVDGADDMTGVFINTVPMRLPVDLDAGVRGFLDGIRQDWVDHRPFEHAPLPEIQAGSDVSTDEALFDSLVVFEKYDLGTLLRLEGGEQWANRNVRLLQHTGYPTTLYGYDGEQLRLELEYDPDRYDAASVDRLLGHVLTLLTGLAAGLDGSLRDVPMLTAAERTQLLVDWNDTDTGYADRCIHELFEMQVAETPDAPALSFGGTTLSYRAVNARANRLARHLQTQGVDAETLVGVYLTRSVDLVVALLAILKAGGAYVPLDPAFPTDRIALMVEDAALPVIVTNTALGEQLPATDAAIVAMDAVSLDPASLDPSDAAAENLGGTAAPEHLAYVIYTSGSTGRPKGVMVEHRNVANFFVGMDDRIEHDPPGVWLAVTSISFDISVLELFWTLARGFHVVLYAQDVDAATLDRAADAATDARTVDFSLFYFSSNEREVDAAEKYRVLLEGAKFGDEHGFKAVWSPERHFHAFGGLFPNPSVTSAALATITDRIDLRAGSCVSPLHDSIRIAEEWSVVDNLSKGRVGISFAAGWQPNDFVLKPENYATRKERMFEQIEEVQALWRGESMHRDTPDGREVDLQILPRPVQADLPVWITAASNPETFRMAGEKGYHLLTHLLGQTVEELAEKIAIYREARRQNGFDPNAGVVTLMLHTYVGTDTDAVRDLVREPMKAYLRSSVGLIKAAAWSFPTFKQRTTDENGRFSVNHLGEAEMDEVLEFSFNRYFETSGLFGDADACLQRVRELKGIAVDEIACLVDFGVDTDRVLDMLPRLAAVKDAANAASEEADADGSGPNASRPVTIADQIRAHGVTHLQCTPTQGSLLVADPETRAALPRLQRLMLGGEALPTALAAVVRDERGVPTTNMYGPTETTIWSTTHELTGGESIIPIGRPIANTQVYLLDDAMRPVPVGVPGNLYIGGDGVTRGYLKRPALTAERFVDDPFRGAGARMYWTGDQARYRADGTIDFLGRTDFQVKVRGYRIELGEIEAVLAQHPTVRDVVVMVREDEPGDKRIVAYAIPTNGALAGDDELRAFLGESLPAYMVPTHFVEMDAFPLTPNKKTDRKALPAPTAATRERSDTHVAPRTTTEAALADAWARILRLDRVGIHEGFFDLGGNSLLALQLVAAIRDALGVSVPIYRIAQAPTVAEMADVVDQLRIEQADADDLQQALAALDDLSDEEVQALLNDQG
jgi:natural product biosynthesis luciferase-like monooxygenase protein